MQSFRERYQRLREQESHPVVRERLGVPVEEIEPGSLRRNEAGEVFIVKQHRRDPHLTNLKLREDLRSSLFLAGHQDALRPEDVLFLDTETTGLAGGTGTHAFLVGLGFFDADDFVLLQLFMRSPAEERALLEELRGLLRRFRVLATFNGKSFDWPLVDTRFLMHGYRLNFDFAHLDLLHPSRRIWKHRLDSCSLTSLEQGVFGIRRNGDVPGYLIPQMYFDYLRDGDARRLSSVFMHNREDIVTLAKLLETVLAAEQDPISQLRHPEDLLGMGLALSAAGAVEAGYFAIAEALSTDELPAVLRRRGETELWRIMKRHDRMWEGVDMLESMCQVAGRSSPIDLFPFIELAKYYEHSARDYLAAGRVVERALQLMDLRGQHSGRDELLHRLNRIRRKQLARQSPQRAP